MMEDAPGSEAHRAGLFASLKGLLGTAVALLGNRLQLLGVELQEESNRLLSLLAYGAITLICLGAGLIFLAVFLTVLFWESNRLLVLGIFSTLFLTAGAITLVISKNLVRTGSHLFAASLAELDNDRKALKTSGPPQPK